MPFGAWFAATAVSFQFVVPFMLPNSWLPSAFKRNMGGCQRYPQHRRHFLEVRGFMGETGSPRVSLFPPGSVNHCAGLRNAKAALL